METACLIFAIVVGGAVALAAGLNIAMSFIAAGILANALLGLTGAAIAACGLLVMKDKL
jgi:hypothetical protein